MSIFENANRKVEKHNYGMNSKFDRFGRRIIDLPEKHEPVTEDITAKIIQGPDIIKPELSEGEKAYRESNVQRAINYNAKTNIMKNMYSEILNGVLENVIGSIYYDALYLDEDFKEYNSAAITESVHDFLSERGGFKYVAEAYDKTKSPLLKSIMKICEETAREISDRKIKECNEKGSDKQSLDDIKIFDMTDDEKNKLDYDKDSIGIDKISGAIKDKILNVVKEEKKREAEHVELMEEIENQLSEDENVNDEKAVAEALSSIFIKNTNIEEGTLFNSMLRKNYKNVIESGYDALTLSKLDTQSELDGILNKVTLESILSEDEIVDPKGQLITTEVKDVFNDFMYKLERQKDLGNTDSEALLEAFASCESKFYEAANSKITKTELKALRRDFKILQETFNDFLPTEDYDYEFNGEELLDPIEEGAFSDQYNEKVDANNTALYTKALKKYTEVDKLKALKKENDEMYKKFKTEMDKRDLDDDRALEIIKTIKNVTIQSIPVFGPSITVKSPQHAPKRVLRRYMRNNRICDKCIRDRIKELKIDTKTIKESFEDFEYDVWTNEEIENDDSFEFIEEGNLAEAKERTLEKQLENFKVRAEEAMEGKSVSELKKAIKENDAAYEKIKEEVDRREKLDENKAKKLLDTVKRTLVTITIGVFIPVTNHKYNSSLVLEQFVRFNRTLDKMMKQRIKELEKGGKKSVKETYEYFNIDDFDTVEEKNIITNNKFVDSVKDKFTPPGSKKKDDKKDKDKEKDEKNGKTKATKEGIDCDNAGGCASSTKEGADCAGTNCNDKKIKKIDTAFDMDEKVKIKEGYDEFFDIDDEFDITEEATLSKAEQYKFTGKNIGTLIMNSIKSKKDINNIHGGLLKIVNRCSSVNEVEFLQKDISGAKTILNKRMENCKTAEERKQIQQHIKWLGSEYSKALSDKKKELKAKEATKNKTVKEACSDILDECMTIIDKKLDLHEASDLNMAREVCVRDEDYSSPTIIPIMNKKDIQLEGLDLPYKMKHVIESLTNILSGISHDDRTDIVSKALQTNKENVSAILESCKSIPSIPVYKINFFNTFNDLLDILTENVNEIAEANKLINFREYDDSFLDMYEDDYTYNVITESFNDFTINGGDEYIDMDFVLADTIAKYTLLETMYTLQLETPKYNDIKNMTNKLLNR